MEIILVIILIFIGLKFLSGRAVIVPRSSLFDREQPNVSTWSQAMNWNARRENDNARATLAHLERLVASREMDGPTAYGIMWSSHPEWMSEWERRNGGQTRH